jgi:hypothetical protein
MKTSFLRKLLHGSLLIVFLFLSPALSAEVMVVVGTKSNLVALNKNQVKDIFLGRLISLPNGSSATPVDQAETNPLREEFYVKVTNQTAAQVKAHWAKLYFTGRGQPPKEAINSSEIKRLLNAIPASIAYIERAALDSTVKVIFTVP